MFILESPYVSPQLAAAAAELGRPVLSTAAARQALDGSTPLHDDASFARAWREAPGARLYTNSENAIGWIRRHLGDTALPAQIESMKDKVRFRELQRDLDPDYLFFERRIDALEDFDARVFGGPFVAKPAVGFFSLGVEIVPTPAAWPAAARRLRAAGERFAGLYPEAVLELDRFVLEQVIEGDEFAVDAWFGDEGDVTIVNVYEHPFAHGADVSDRVYRVRPAVIERTHDLFVEHLCAFGRRAGLRNVPIHVEFRIDAAGRVRPIEANPMRFGGWCAADITSHGWGFCPYTSFVRGERPNWDQLCAERRGTTTALIVADLPADLDRSRVSHIDFDGFLARFSEPLELRPVLDPRQPVFAFVFVRVPDEGLDELDAILTADLTTHITLDRR